MTDIKIEVIGIEKIQAALNKFPRAIAKYLGQAGDEAAKKVVLKTPGLKDYPPATAANRLPYPYYERGKGTWTSAAHNTYTSERLGTQWYVKKEGMGTAIGNRASYAHWVVGDDQPVHMKQKGWRKLLDVVTEKMSAITAIYQRWAEKLIRDLGLS